MTKMVWARWRRLTVSGHTEWEWENFDNSTNKQIDSHYQEKTIFELKILDAVHRSFSGFLL